MADRIREIKFLREQAQRIREIVKKFATPISADLLAMADEMEARAEDLEAET